MRVLQRFVCRHAYGPEGEQTRDKRAERPEAAPQRYDLTSNETKAELMKKFPFTSVHKEIPIMWNFQHAA